MYGSHSTHVYPLSISSEYLYINFVSRLSLLDGERPQRISSTYRGRSGFRYKGPPLTGTIRWIWIGRGGWREYSPRWAPLNWLIIRASKPYLNQERYFNQTKYTGTVLWETKIDISRLLFLILQQQQQQQQQQQHNNNKMEPVVYVLRLSAVLMVCVDPFHQSSLGFVWNDHLRAVMDVLCVSLNTWHLARPFHLGSSLTIWGGNHQFQTKNRNSSERVDEHGRKSDVTQS